MIAGIIGSEDSDIYLKNCWRLIEVHVDFYDILMSMSLIQNV